MASASSSLSSRYRALIRSSLVLKYVNRVPSATPACLDISEVGAAVRPRSANTRVAASRIAFRLSSLLGRAIELLDNQMPPRYYTRKGWPAEQINEHPIIHSIILCPGGYCD